MGRPAQATVRVRPPLDAAREKAGRIRRGVIGWWRSARRSYPWRAEGRTAYEVLVAEVLLKRTTASAAARVYEEFLKRFPTVQAIYEARESEVEAALLTVGLQRQRAKGFKEMARHLIEVEGGEIPTELGRLAMVPHVGPYGGAAVASFAMGIPVAVVDSNVERILRRVFGDSLTPKDDLGVLSSVAQTLLPPSQHREFNLALLDLGAAICRYVRPRCRDCPVQSVCDYGIAQVTSPPPAGPSGKAAAS